VTDPAELLAALQLSDSALPIGRFVHSHGIEAWLRAHCQPHVAALAELIKATVSEAVAPLDGATLAHAHRARSLQQLIDLDQRLTARKLTPTARHASWSCGGQLAALGAKLAAEDPLVTGFASTIADGHSDGNLAVIEGTLARALGIAAHTAVLIELRSTAAGLLSAAIRLDAISPTRAQLVLADMAPALTSAARTALSLDIGELSATAPELEIAALTHRRSDARMFAS
jgi:urease accessory protein